MDKNIQLWSTFCVRIVSTIWEMCYWPWLKTPSSSSACHIPAACVLVCTITDKFISYKLKREYTKTISIFWISENAKGTYSDILSQMWKSFTNQCARFKCITVQFFSLSQNMCSFYCQTIIIFHVNIKRVKKAKNATQSTSSFPSEHFRISFPDT